MSQVTLSQTAPWNADLTNPYRTRYTTAGGRYFRAAAESLNDFWWLDEITKDGKVIDAGPDEPQILCRNLASVRQCVAGLVEGKTRSEVYTEALNAPGAPTGRNHPRNVAVRAAWRH